MLFRWRRRRDPLERAWSELADRLGLEASPQAQTMLAELLGLTADAWPRPIYRVTETGPVDVYVFAFYRPEDTAGSTPRQQTACLLVSGEKIAAASWRATRKLHDVLASLRASATGGEIVVVPGEPRFNANVTVVARSSGSVLPQLDAATRAVLERSLGRQGAAREITVGEEQILISVAAPKVALDTIESMLTDLLSLYAALRS